MAAAEELPRPTPIPTVDTLAGTGDLDERDLTMVAPPVSMISAAGSSSARSRMSPSTQRISSPSRSATLRSPSSCFGELSKTVTRAPAAASSVSSSRRPGCKRALRGGT